MGAFFGALSAPHYGYQPASAANERAEGEQGHQSQIDRDRAGLPYFAERITSGPDPDDGSEREKRDLAAQESMSVWAFWLLIASIAGTAATIIGTALLVWTLHETRQTSRRQLRAYLSFGQLDISVNPSSGAKGGLKLTVETTVINGGSTPAYDCLHMGNIVAFTEQEARRYFSKTEIIPRIGVEAPYTVHNGRDAPAIFYANEDLRDNEVKDIESGAKHLYAFGSVVYRDTFDNERRTRFCFFLASPLLPKNPDPSGRTITRMLWGLAPFHNDAS
ncbi:hypothetical protein [Erythrobacter longus]|uniref:hypothetical protein n=1 Tax=Erythrobacter longus TaxID=1044 RepID=UPI0019D6C58E|nr:hypothetical protein [Erythrobacter longus]